FTLRLMPIEAAAEQGNPVNTDALYDQIKNKYVWGNMNEAPYLDPETYRMISLVLNNVYSAAAEGLLAEGRIEEAREVLADGLANMPDRIFRIMDSYAYSFIVDNLYEAGMTEEAQRII